MSLVPPSAPPKGEEARITENKQSPQPDRLPEYENALLSYPSCPTWLTGRGQTHFPPAAYLRHQPGTESVDLQPDAQEFVTLYPLGIEQFSRRSSSQSSRHHPSSDGDAESTDKNQQMNQTPISFQDPSKCYHFNLDKPHENCIIFLRGFMTKPWINNIGARYLVDPDSRQRKQDFRPIATIFICTSDRITSRHDRKAP
ncbi:hypothetical protein Neosp_011118 [[Neocosmospora] mangrovei]